jgi:alkylhydroperoxidase family enzyme
MAIVQPIEVSEATGDSKVIFDGIQQRLGSVPNLLRLLGHSPAALRGYLDFSDAFHDEMSKSLRTLLTLTVTQIAGADYVLSFACAVGKREGLSDEEMSAARRGDSADAKTAVVLRFAAKAVREHGHVADADLAAVRDAGYTEVELKAIVAYISIIMFRVYFTLMAGLAIDYPLVKSADLADAQSSAA